MLPNSLKKLFQSGGAFASFIQIIGYLFPAWTVGAVAAVIVSIWTGAVEWIQKPHVYIPILVFGYLFLMIATLKSRLVKIKSEYEHAISPEGGPVVLHAQFPSDHKSHGNEAALLLAHNFRSVCNSAMRVRVEEFDIELDGRSFKKGHPPFPDSVWARLSQKTINCPMIVRDQSKTNLIGSASIKILYGPVNGRLTRRYTMITELEVMIQPQGIGAIEAITTETDEPYVER
jgi:hypothetical protein